MGLAVVLVNEVGGDVPAAVVAAGRLVIAAVAVQRAAEEELLQPAPCLIVEIAGVQRQVQRVAAAVAAPRAEAIQQRGVVVVQASRHHSLAVTQRTGDAELGRDGLADEGALVGQLVEQLGQLALDLEGHDRSLGRLACHVGVPGGGWE